MKKIALIVVLLIVSLTACNLGDVQLQPLSAPAQEELPSPTSTIEPPPQPTATTTPIPSATPDYGDVFKDARLLNTRALNDMDFLVVIETKKDLPAGSLTAIVVSVGDKEYNCTLLEQFVRRMYCVGEPPEIGEDTPVMVKVTGSSAGIFEASFKVESLPAITPPETLDATQKAALAAAPSQTPTITATVNMPVAGTPAAGTPVAGTPDAVPSQGTPGLAGDVLQPGGMAGGGKEGIGGGIGPTATPEGTSQP